MKTYLRMIRMVRPYLTQLIIAIVFMVLFSLTSAFSITMLSPFLRALFTEGGSEVVVPALIDQGNAPSAAPTAAAEALNFFQQAEHFFKERLLASANATLLAGTKKDALLRICLWAFVILLVKNLTDYVQQVLMAYVGQSIIRDLRDKIFLKYTSLPLAFFHRHRAGELISRATNDVQIAHNTVNVSFTNLVRDPIMILIYLAAACLLSWKLTLLAMLMIPPSLVVIIQIGRLLRKFSHRQQEQTADMTSVLQETVYGIRVIKAFAMERFENSRFLQQSRRLYREIFRIQRTQRISSPLTEQIMSVVAIFMLWYGGNQVFGEELAPDQFLIFLFFIFSLVHPVKELGHVNTNIQLGMAAADRIFTILDTEPEVPDTEAGHVVETVEGRLEFQGVHFHYVEGEPVLAGVDLVVEPGEIVALVGSSGGGKSTLVDLIPRFYDPVSGRILLDGQDLRDLNLASLRQNMGIVTQEVILFNDSVRNNIAYGLGDIPQEKIEEAARAANAHDFIARMPDGYDTEIGDRGVKLSGGQRQRISIARAILKNPAILLLDEATSALDTESELVVQEAIDRLVASRTTLVIAHRLSTIQNADHIYVLDQGRFVQTGTHRELLEAGGIYKGLYELQFRE